MFPIPFTLHYPSLLARFWRALRVSFSGLARVFFLLPLLLCSAAFLFKFPVEKSNMPKKQGMHSTLTCSRQHQWIETRFQLWRLTDATDMTPLMCVCFWQHMRLEVTSGADGGPLFDKWHLFCLWREHRSGIIKYSELSWKREDKRETGN